MKIIYLIIFILFFYLVNILLLDERNKKEHFENLYSIKKNYKIDPMDYYRCRIIEDYNHLNCDKKKVLRIAFGSCNSQYKNQEYWQKIMEYDPKLWIWLGDNIYADYFPKDYSKEKINDIIKNSYLDHMEEQYVKQVNDKYYTQFLNSGIEITGIWDDHDYFSNNTDYLVDTRNINKAKQLFFDFININKSDRYLEKPAEDNGIYRTYYIKSDNGSNLVKVFLLDTRTFKSGNDILGIKQWRWLKRELINSNAKLNLIASGIQVMADRDKEDTEAWSSIGNSKMRLMQMLKCIGKSNVIILSGDIHKSCIKSNYGFFEITASPLTNFISKYNYPHKNNIGAYINKNNYGFIEIHWKDEESDNLEIEKLIVGFNDTVENKSNNVLEIK